jgi:hypothetical protein
MKQLCFVIAALFVVQPIIATAQNAPVTTKKHHKSNAAGMGTPSGTRMGTSPSSGNPAGSHHSKRKQGQGKNGGQGTATGQLNNGNLGNKNQGSNNRGNGNRGNGNQGNGNRGNGNVGNGNTRGGNNAGSNNRNNGNTRNTNINNNNVNVNNNVISNPVYGGGGAYGWNGGAPWYPTTGYWGGGFWGAMAIGVTSAAVGAAVYGSMVGPNNTTYNSYQVQPNTPGYTFLQNYQLVQVECGPPNLVVVYGPENSVVCAAPNNLVAAGNYTLDTQTLSLTPMH